MASILKLSTGEIGVAYPIQPDLAIALRRDRDSDSPLRKPTVECRVTQRREIDIF